MPLTQLHCPHLLLLLLLVLSCLVSAVRPTPCMEGCLLCTQVLTALWLLTCFPAEGTLCPGNGLSV